MDNTKGTHLRMLQSAYREGLRWGCIILTEFFIAWTLMQYVVKEREYLKYQKWIGVAILTAALIYVVIAVFTDREELRRIGAFLKSMCSFEQIMLILIMLWYILGCAVRSRLDKVPLFSFNDNRLFMFTMTVFLFFPFVNLMGKRAGRVIDGMIHFTLPAYSIFLAWCIVKFYRVELIYFPSGLKLTLWRKGVSMTIGGNINITAAASVILFGLCLYMILTKNKIIRIIYIPAAVIQFMTVILTGSRTSFLAITFISMGAAILFTWDVLRDRELRIRLAAAVLSAVLCAAAILAAQRVLIKMFEHVYPESTKYDVKIEKPETEESAEQAAQIIDQSMYGAKARELLRQATGSQFIRQRSSDITVRAAGNLPGKGLAGETGNGDIEMEEGPRKMNDLSSRTSIWKCAVQIMLSSPGHFLFGVSPCYTAKRLQEATGLGNEITHAHNGILQMGVGLGVPAMLLFILFEASLVIRCLFIILGKRNGLIRGCWIIPVVILGILVIELVEAMLFAMPRFNIPAFYMLAGCCVMMDRKRKFALKK